MAHGSRALLISAALLLLTAYSYWNVRSSDFVRFDDGDYVTENRRVQTGLNWGNVTWAFTSYHSANWHPLTWISHMADCYFYGLDAGGHHTTSLVIHLANSVLLFLALWRLTGTLWRSGTVAALFAVHPIHVESVAWIAERKDVLSAFFGILTLLAYASYARNRTVLRYAGILVLFSLGLMAKPMLVTLPFVLLLLDCWPLGTTGKTPARARFNRPGWIQVAEKLPLLGLALVSSIITFRAQRAGMAVAPLSALPLQARFENAVVSYVRYLGKIFQPKDLAFFYPMQPVEAWRAAGASLLLVAITITVICLAARRPYLPVGWFWYLGTLVPVIGIIQVGDQALADRYTYLPSIGLFIALVWALHDVLAALPASRPVYAVSVLAVLGLLTGTTRAQVGYWRNSVTLFEHAIEVTPNNYVAHTNLGLILAEQGRPLEAISHYHEAIRSRPDFADAYINLGIELVNSGKPLEAYPYLTKALRLNPNHPKAHFNFGLVLAGRGEWDQAIDQYLQALRLKPEYPEAHQNLAIALAQKGALSEALSHYREALRMRPDYVEAHINMGIDLAGAGRIQEALEEFQQAARINPNSAEAHYNLAKAYALTGKRPEALREFQVVQALNPGLAARLHEITGK
jgi:tetratricopeptide (TPR) repeat protein